MADPGRPRPGEEPGPGREDEAHLERRLLPQRPPAVLESIQQCSHQQTGEGPYTAVEFVGSQSWSRRIGPTHSALRPYGRRLPPLKVRITQMSVMGFCTTAVPPMPSDREAALAGAGEREQLAALLLPAGDGKTVDGPPHPTRRNRAGQVAAQVQHLAPHPCGRDAPDALRQWPKTPDQPFPAHTGSMDVRSRREAVAGWGGPGPGRPAQVTQTDAERGDHHRPGPPVAVGASGRALRLTPCASDSTLIHRRPTAPAPNATGNATSA